MTSMRSTNGVRQHCMARPIYNGSDSMVQLLVDHGARLDVADNSGKTLLAIADGKPTDGVYGHVNHPSTVKLLRSLGAQ